MGCQAQSGGSGRTSSGRLWRAAPALTVDAVLARAHLKQERNKKVRALSGGLLRRLGIAQALLVDADILLPDEPTAGLDPKERAHMRNLVSELAGERLILLSTHIVEDVEYIADTVAILKEGELLRHAPTAALLAELEGKIGEVRLDPRQMAAFEANHRVLRVRPEDRLIAVRLFSETLPNGVAPAAPNLEDAYLVLAEPETDA